MTSPDNARMNSAAFLLLAAASILAASPLARAQTAPTAEALGLARSLVQKSGAGGQMAMAGLVMPPPGFVASLGVTDPQHVPVVTHDAVLSTLGDHEDALTEIQVKSYASLLSIAEMKAAIAFFDSAAGKAFVRFRTTGIQTAMGKAVTLITNLQPEIEAQSQEVARAHGWPHR